MRRSLQAVLIGVGVSVLIRFGDPGVVMGPGEAPQPGRPLRLCALGCDEITVQRVLRVLQSDCGLETVPRARLVGLELSAFRSDEREQFDANALVNAMKPLAEPAEGACLAIVDVDLYTSGNPDWKYCYGVTGGHVAVLSSKRLRGQSLRKMVMRYAGRLVFDLPDSNDPRSVMFHTILGPRDLRRAWPRYY